MDSACCMLSRQDNAAHDQTIRDKCIILAARYVELTTELRYGGLTEKLGTDPQLNLRQHPAVSDVDIQGMRNVDIRHFYIYHVFSKIYVLKT